MCGVVLKPMSYCLLFSLSFKLRSVGVSGRWGDVHPKDETPFLACAAAPVKQLWALCVPAGSGASGHKDMGRN